MNNLDEHTYEWYIAEKDEYIYDNDVVQYLTPRYKEAKSIVNSIAQLIDELELSDNLVGDYLELGELISTLECILESRDYHE